MRDHAQRLANGMPSCLWRQAAFRVLRAAIRDSVYFARSYKTPIRGSQGGGPSWRESCDMASFLEGSNDARTTENGTAV